MVSIKMATVLHTDMRIEKKWQVDPQFGCSD